MNILLVEDDEVLGEGLSDFLEESGFNIKWLKNGQLAKEQIESGSNFDIVVLDIGLPVLNGFKLLSWMRENNNQTPVLFLTARDTVEEKIHGLNMGADDYVAKPFEFKELLARLNALSRRGGNVVTPKNTLKWGNFVLDMDSHLLLENGRVVDIPQLEFKLLELLLTNAPKFLSREELEEVLYGTSKKSHSNTLDVFVYNIRKRMGKKSIINSRHLGWRMGDEEN